MSDDVSDDQLQSVTRRVLDQLTYQGLLFTALDVSNAVKHTLAGVRHRRISPVVRQLYEDGALGEGYVRSTIEVHPDGNPNKTATAYLYHLDDADPAEYTARTQVAMAPVSAAVGDDTTLDPGIASVSLMQGSDGRLRVPRQLLERAGVDTEQVEVHQLGMRQLLLTPLPWGQPPTGAGVLVYVHPSHLHVARKYLSEFDPSQPIVAEVDAQRGCVALRA